MLILLSDGGVHSHIDHLLYVNHKIKKSHPNMEVIVHRINRIQKLKTIKIVPTVVKFVPLGGIDRDYNLIYSDDTI